MGGKNPLDRISPDFENLCFQSLFLTYNSLLKRGGI